MKNRIICIVLGAIGLGIIISILVFKPKAGEKNLSNVNEEIYQLCCQGNDKTSCFDIDIANTDESRTKGLMFREKLENNEGMLFIFDDESIHSFWMKNTIIPLAGIRIDKNMKIVDIILMNPCKTENCPSYIPNEESMYVLEINQNLITEENILKIGYSCYLNEG